MEKMVFATKLTFFDKEFLSVEEFAHHLKVSPLTLQKWRCNSKGPKFIKVGSKVIYRGQDIKEWLNKHIYENTFSLIDPLVLTTPNKKDSENARRKSAV